MKMKKKLVFLVALTIISLIPLTAFGADIHSSGYSSVDLGEIRWGGSTKYSSGLSTSIDRWNAMGRVAIAPDTVYSTEDLTYIDAYRSDVSWDGVYINKVFADTIQYNNYYLDMSKYTYSVIRGVQTHEIGHALGIGDHYSGIYSNTTMYGYTFDSNGNPARPDGLSDHDKSDYNALH
jgi:hypothetical protein